MGERDHGRGSEGLLVAPHGVGVQLWSVLPALCLLCAPKLLIMPCLSFPSVQGTGVSLSPGAQRNALSFGKFWG